MSYVYKKTGFGRDLLPVARDVVPLDSTGIMQETIVAPARSQYEVVPTLLRPTVEATPEPIPLPITPMVDPRLVMVDERIFPNAGWAPVAPSSPVLDMPYYITGPAPVVSAALMVEPVDSVAQSTRSVTEFPLDSQMAAADASLAQQLLSRGMPTEYPSAVLAPLDYPSAVFVPGGGSPVAPEYPSAVFAPEYPSAVLAPGGETIPYPPGAPGGETIPYPPGAPGGETIPYPPGGEAEYSIPYTTPLIDSKFTDPYRDPSRFTDASERPDMDPDYTEIPYTTAASAPARTAYVQDNGLTELPMEDVIVPPRELEVASLRSYVRAQTLTVPRAPDTIPVDTRTGNVPSCNDGFHYDMAMGVCVADVPEVSDTSSNYRRDAGFDLPGVPETKTVAPADAATACAAKGGNYVYDAASGQYVCLPVQMVQATPAASSTPWLLIGAAGLAAYLLLKR
jgi:hypothetical protein